MNKFSKIVSLLKELEAESPVDIAVELVFEAGYSCGYYQDKDKDIEYDFDENEISDLASIICENHGFTNPQEEDEEKHEKMYNLAGEISSTLIALVKEISKPEGKNQ